MLLLLCCCVYFLPLERFLPKLLLCMGRRVFHARSCEWDGRGIFFYHHRAGSFPLLFLQLAYLLQFRLLDFFTGTRGSWFTCAGLGWISLEPATVFLGQLLFRGGGVDQSQGCNIRPGTQLGICVLVMYHNIHAHNEFLIKTAKNVLVRCGI